jgi:hypothetical protein
MATLIELQAFQKMWTWLSSHPAHDQNYYMTHVAQLDKPWPKSCPLCHSAAGSCKDCDPLWKSESGGLCDDQESPLNKWRQTSIEDPDNRTWFANRVAILSQQALRSMQGKKG